MNRFYSLLFALILLSSFASAADVAYILKSSTGIDPYLVNEFTSRGLTVQEVYESDIPSTNLSEFTLIVVGDQNLANPSLIPIDKYKTIVINSYDYYYSSQLALSGSSGTKTSPSQAKIILFADPIAKGLPAGNFNLYSGSDANVKVSYLKGSKPYGTRLIVTTSTSSADAIIASFVPGTNLLNNKVTKERIVFFGAVKPQYWTPEAHILFNNSLNWVLFGEDKDLDGFYSDFDCNDNNASINPSAIEIPYNGIDEDCLNSDAADLDLDGYCKLGVTISNKTIQCPSEINLIGSDCNDNNASISPGSSDIYNNCRNDAPIIQPIPNVISRENTQVLIQVFASDPENDFLSYYIDDPRFYNVGNKFYWGTTYSDAGVYTFTITVSDGQLNSTSEVQVTINERNQAPTFSQLDDIIWAEDGQYSLNLSNYTIDLDNDNLAFGVENTSQDSHIQVISPAPGIMLFSSEENWSGSDWIKFWVYDGEAKVVSPQINLYVSPVNDAPYVLSTIPEITFNEDSSLIDAINLSDYFKDIDSNLSFTFADNTLSAIQIVDNSVSFISIPDLNGMENITFTASDGEFNISSQVQVTIVPKDEIPTLLPLNCSTTINEDESSSCILEATDIENDSITFTSSNESNLNCSISGNVLTYQAPENYFGNASCTLTASDDDGSDSKILDILINPVNDAPYNLPLPLLSIEEDILVQNAINLSDYFKDIDSNLSYNLSTPQNFTVSLSDSMLSIAPNTNWNGNETITITASDEEYSISQDLTIYIFSIGDAPTLLPLNCSTTINEDESSSCILEATDIENDSITFTSSNESNLNCSISGNVLTYQAFKDYNGEASCDIFASDLDGNSTITLNVNISPVNDAPKIISYSPQEEVITMPNIFSRTFSVSATDIDSQTSTSWYVNGLLKGSGNTYVFSGFGAGNYNLQAVVSDSFINETKSWTVVVGELSQYTCSQVSGYTCSTREICQNDFLGVSDSRCCSTQCIPSFDDADSCNSLNNSIIVSISSPDNSDEFELGDRIPIEIEVQNKLSEDQSFDISAHIYNLDSDESVISEEASNVEINENGKRTTKIYLDIPEDLELGDSYVIFAKADDSACNQAFQSLNLQRKEHSIIIKEFDVPETASCGDEIPVKVKIQNLGSSDEDVTISLENKALGISQASETIELEQAEQDDTATRTFSLSIPQNISGNHSIQVKASYKLSVTDSKRIEIDCIVPEKSNIDETQNKTLLSTLKLTAIQEKKDYSYLLTLFLSLLVALAIFIIIFIIYILFKPKKEEPYSFPKNAEIKKEILKKKLNESLKNKRKPDNTPFRFPGSEALYQEDPKAGKARVKGYILPGSNFFKKQKY